MDTKPKCCSRPDDDLTHKSCMSPRRESYRGPLLVAVQAPGGYERLTTSLPMLAEFP